MTSENFESLSMLSFNFAIVFSYYIVLKLYVLSTDLQRNLYVHSCYACKIRDDFEILKYIDIELTSLISYRFRCSLVTNYSKLYRREN